MERSPVPGKGGPGGSTSPALGSRNADAISGAKSVLMSQEELEREFRSIYEAGLAGIQSLFAAADNLLSRNAPAQQSEEDAFSEPLNDDTSSQTEPGGRAEAEGKTLHLREISLDELQDPKMKELAELLGCLSPGSVFIATEDSSDDLSGTVVTDGIRLQRLISREKHSDVYAIAVCDQNSVWKEDSLRQVHAYTLHGLPKALATYRRRSMRRVSGYESAMGPFRKNKRIFWICSRQEHLSSDKTHATNPLVIQERKRVKQLENRRRDRAQNRDIIELSCKVDISTSIENSGKSRRLNQRDRDLKFILGFYDTDKPQIDTTTATDVDWVHLIEASESIRRARNEEMNKIFRDVQDMNTFAIELRKELSFVKKQQARLPELRRHLLLKHRNATKSGETGIKDVIKFGYAICLIPSLVAAMESRNRRLSDRLELFARCQEKCMILQRRWTKLESLQTDQARLSDIITSVTPGSPAWKTSQIELRNVESQIRELGDPVELKKIKDLAWKLYDIFAYW